MRIKTVFTDPLCGRQALRFRRFTRGWRAVARRVRRRPYIVPICCFDVRGQMEERRFEVMTAYELSLSNDGKNHGPAKPKG